MYQGGHKVNNCLNLKGQQKGSGRAQARGSNVDPEKKNHFYALPTRGE